MHVEKCCQALLASILPVMDRQREGVCLDVGVGTFDFYCELFARLRFRTAAVEPLPVEALRRTCRRHRIALIEGVLSDVDGIQTLYVGTFRGVEDLNVSSLVSNWWGAGTKTIDVQAMTLSTLLSTIGAQVVTCLKLDIEGMEFSIIRQLLGLADSLLPRVVMLEYGGGDSKESGRAGWSPQFLDATMQCLAVLKDRGYRFSVFVDSSPEATERSLDLSSSNLDPDEVFPPSAVYGNIISLRHLGYPQVEIAGICRPYRDNEAAPPKLVLRERRLVRLLRRLQEGVLR